MQTAIPDADLLALQFAGLPVVQHAPFLITGVSSSIYSTARHAFGATVQGYAYTYLPDTDELIREDVAKWLRKRRADEAREQKRLARAVQYVLEPVALDASPNVERFEPVSVLRRGGAL